MEARARVHDGIPRRLYVGPERYKKIKINPLPPEEIVYEHFGEYHSLWGQPCCDNCEFAVQATYGAYGSPVDCGFPRPNRLRQYSIRSVLLQFALNAEFPCKYFTRSRVDEQGLVEWTDHCASGYCDGFQPKFHPCAIATGWTGSSVPCRGWDFLSGLCQTPTERHFLFQYLRFSRDEEYPMAIPQALVGVGDEFRVDFAVFVPQKGDLWRWLAVEIDDPATHYDHGADQTREDQLTEEGYEVVRFSTDDKGIEQARRFIRQIRT